MPHILVKLREGYSRAQKHRLAREVMGAIVTALDCPTFDVSVAIEDVRPAEWMERVYEPDIRDKARTVFKQPGYAPKRDTF